MPENKSLVDINFGDLSKPATVLIEKISDAVGVLYESKRIIKRAEAEAKADKIKAIASIELSDIEKRGIERLVHQEARKQENIEAITAQAIPLLNDDSNVSELEEDWVAYFFRSCDDISDKDMQSLWSKLLSEEANNTGAISKRTINLISAISKSDAQLFTNLCQFTYFMGTLEPMILEWENEIYESQKINFNTLRHLESIGLITLELTSGYVQSAEYKVFPIQYFDSKILVEFEEEGVNVLRSGKAMFTQVGKELAPICGAKRNDEFYEYFLSKLRKMKKVKRVDEIK